MKIAKAMGLIALVAGLVQQVAGAFAPPPPTSPPPPKEP